MSAGEDWSDAMGLHCATCRYWSDRGVDTAEGNEGNCKRHPPQLVPALAAELAGIDGHGFDDMIALSSAFPMTKDYDWCGEYASAEIHPTADVLPSRITVIEADAGTGKSYRTRGQIDESDL